MTKRVIAIVFQRSMHYQYVTEAAAITLSETSSLIADQLSMCILQADAHYPAQLAVCIAPGNISVLIYRCILYYGVYRTSQTDVGNDRYIEKYHDNISLGY